MLLRSPLSRRSKGIISLIFGFAVVLFGAHRLYAQGDFKIDTALTYEVESSGSTKVLEDYTVTGSGSNKYLDSITLSTPVDDASEIKAAYADGAPIPFTVSTKTSNEQGYPYTYKEILLKFPRKNTSSTPWKFNLSYNTAKLVDIKGSARTLYVPAVSSSQDQAGSYSVYVTVPRGFDPPRSSGAIPTSEGIVNGRAVYSFTQADLAKQAIALTFGDQTVYNVNFNFPLKNDSPLPRTMTVTLPPDTSSQKIYINSLEPRPKATRLDADGNVLADYQVPAKSNITVKTDISAEVKYLEYDLAASGTKSDIPSTLVRNYTGSTRYWQSVDSDIIIKAKQVAAGAEKVSDQVKAIHNSVIETLTYNDAKIKYNIRQGASKALDNPTNAVCLEYSDLMIAMLRAQGIPARMPVGYAYTGDLKASREVADSLHSWVEAYIPNVGWINVDPTWGEKYDNFGKSDLDHFAFAIWGQDDSLPTPVMVGEADQGYQYEQTKISYGGQLTKPKLTAGVVATRWVLLPFVSLVQYEVSGPQGVAGDNYELVVNGALQKKIELGSLAPSQQVAGFLPLIGQSFLGTVGLEFKQAGAVPTALSKVDAQSNYVPVAIVMTLVIVVVMIILLKWVLKRKHSKADQQANEPKVASEPADGQAPRSQEEILKEITERTRKLKDDSDKQAK
jgi:transglutaminase-like putative cysteine protease